MRKRKLITVMVSALLTLAAVSTVYAGTWKQDHVGWWWQNEDGSWPSAKWEWLDGNSDGVSECYYFNESGYMLADTVTPDGYTVNKDGMWIQNGAVQQKATNTVVESDNR